jgi:hypothetical protein
MCGIILITLYLHITMFVADEEHEHDQELDQEDGHPAPGTTPEAAAAALEGLRDEYNSHDREQLVTEHEGEEEEGPQQQGAAKQKGRGGKAKAGAGAATGHVNKKVGGRWLA